MAKRIVEWDDFTGGYYVGPSATKQPRNTFQGDNVTVAMDDASLIPMYQAIKNSLTGTDCTGGIISNGNLVDISQPAELNNIICFTAKTATTAYLYVIDSLAGTVSRNTLSLAGSVANFNCARPVMLLATNNIPTPGGIVTGDDLDVYIPGDYRKLIRYQLDAGGSVKSGYPVTYNLNCLTATGDTNLLGLCVWGARLVGWSNTSNLYFSDAADFATWAATNYIVIGYNNDRISHVIPRNYDLIIGKPSGWYVVTGVLNYSAAVRQINNGLGVLYTDGIAEWNNQVAFSTNTGTIGFPVNLYTVNGARVQPMAFQRFAGNIQTVYMAKGPLGMLQVCYTNDDDTDVNGVIWTLNQQNRWSKTLLSNYTVAATGDNVRYYPTQAAQSRSATWTTPSLDILEWNVSKGAIALHSLSIPTFEPGKNANGTPAVAVAKLVDFMSQVPISVTDVFVEVEVAQLLYGYNYTGDGQVSAQVNMKYPLGDLALSVGDVSSTNLTYTTSISTIPGTGTRFLGRMYRFKPDNAGHGYGFEIQVTFSGCKVRRIVAMVETHE